jgi:triosephosphate isomerase
MAHGESDELIAKKVAAAQLAGLTTIVCVGETMEQKACNLTEGVIEQQVIRSLPEKLQTSQLVVAYEPVWAIGTGEIPEVDDIRRVHKHIRKSLGALGETVQIIYGGSVTPSNAGDILADSEIDGVLVGSASLNAEGFWAIAAKCP